MPTDTSERGLERLMCMAMTGSACDGTPSHVSPTGEAVASAGGTGWICGRPGDYDRQYTVDLMQLSTFLEVTQPDAFERLGLGEDSPKLRKFLARLQGQVDRRGIIDVLRNGIKHGPVHVELFYGTPSPGNLLAEERYAQNRFSVTRQLHYSLDTTQHALDLCLFVNGLPIATFELKNSLTKQTVQDAVEQYKRDRNPREKLFQFGRCVAHFAVDDHEVRFCTHLKGKDSWFLPFNQGWNDGAGNPPNPHGLKTAYVWERILTTEGLTEILENYAQVIETKDKKTGRKRKNQIWPRYHQLDVVRRLLAAAKRHGAGNRYLIQHSAGSGKSNSIAWLAHQLVPLGDGNKNIFDSIVVVTDRRILDKQIRDTIKQFAQVRAMVGHAEDARDLRRFIEGGKKIIVSTVQKFPHILEGIGNEQRGRNFAIIIDEAHSSQGGRTAAALSTSISQKGVAEEGETIEDTLNRLCESRRLPTNASYFAFTATPKNKTLELFGEPYQAGDQTKHRPFHSYTMKQAIQEGFILDVLRYYTSVKSYYKLIKKTGGDPKFDSKRAQKKLRRYVEGHEHAIRLKAEIMVDHFHDQVLALNKLGRKARAMVVTGGIKQAIQYYRAIQAYLQQRKSQYEAICAFSGEHELGGERVSEASLNGFPSGQIPDKFQEDPYRFLVCADKFQTGYDEPLLHTMYVDKGLSDIKAVQTLSRLNRAHPQKHDVFVLDFMNDADVIGEAFSDYYRTTILSDKTDPDQLHDLKATLDGHQVYSEPQIDKFVELYIGKADRDRLDPILDRCVSVYKEQLDEDGQVEFKGKAKAFLRAYDFLASILPYANREWERLSIFLQFLVLKLPAPVEEDLSKGILELIDMESYRVEKEAAIRVQLTDEDAEIDPTMTGGGGQGPDLELDPLSVIIGEFNDLFGNIAWQDADRVRRLITKEIPAKVSSDAAYRNARENSDRQNARIEHDQALGRAMSDVLRDDMELYKQYKDDKEGFGGGG